MVQRDITDFSKSKVTPPPQQDDKMPPIETVLIDIEGTVCSISFVKDVLFPYAMERLPSYLEKNWDSESFQPYKAAFPEEAQKSQADMIEFIKQLSQMDSKMPCWKQLQGVLWVEGYHDGSLQAVLFPDALPALQSWKERGLDIVVFSSGSVPAQKLLFQHTEQGDVTPLFSDYFDTVNAGSKIVPESYQKIASECGKDVGKWLFLSDNVKEIAAAKEAGMEAFVVDRPGNAPLSEEDRASHRVIANGFEEVTEYLKEERK